VRTPESRVQIRGEAGLEGRDRETRWLTATLSTLQSGLQKYIDRCGGCHSRHLPSEFTEEQWRKAVGDMQQRARVSPEEKERILLHIAVTRSH
jgi:hypothetical protein